MEEAYDWNSLIANQQPQIANACNHQSPITNHQL